MWGADCSAADIAPTGPCCSRQVQLGQLRGMANQFSDFFIFRGSYGDFRSLRTIREAGLWAMRRLKCPGHSDCAQIATWWPSDDAMARVPREVPRDRGTRVHTPSHCPGASFGSPPQGAALADRFWDLATSSTGFEYTRAVRDPRSGEPGQGRPSPDPTWPPTHSLCGRAV